MTDKQKKCSSKLSREILWLLFVTAVIAVFFFGFVSLTANSISAMYLMEHEIQLTEIQRGTLHVWIRSLSVVSSVILFLILFLILLSQKMAYLRVIIQGIEALRLNRLDYTIPLDGNNELTELAKRINDLSDAERRLRQRETELLQQEKQLIRDLSHDIRTPLTAIKSYTEYMAQREMLDREEMNDYISLIQRKTEQMRVLTDRLLDGGKRNPETILDGKLMMEQLIDEWKELLEDTVACIIDIDHCPAFCGRFDIRELQQIFDNLASNIEKYADRSQPVELKIDVFEHRLRICQKNRICQNDKRVESNRIGLESVRRIAALYGGTAEVCSENGIFSVQITLFEISE